MNLKNARVLISNDDGIGAPGLKTLERAIKPLVKEVWVVGALAQLHEDVEHAGAVGTHRV